MDDDHHGTSGPLTRRSVLRAGAALGMGLALVPAGFGTALAGPAGFPTYSYRRTVLTASALTYNPTNEIIFPCIRGTIRRLTGNYVMVFMTNDLTNRRKIGWGWSADGRNWSFDQQPLVLGSDVGDLGRMHLMEVGNDFSRRTQLGTFHTPTAGFPDRGRSAAPSFGTENGVEYMFYEAGSRLGGAIAVARAN